MTSEKSYLIPEFPHASWGVCKAPWCHQLKILLACQVFLWLFNPRLSLNKLALGDGQINICNGKSTKGQIILCTQCCCLFCNTTGWLLGRRLQTWDNTHTQCGEHVGEFSTFPSTLQGHKCSTAASKEELFCNFKPKTVHGGTSWETGEL